MVLIRFQRARASIGRTTTSPPGRDAPRDEPAFFIVEGTSSLRGRLIWPYTPSDDVKFGRHAGVLRAGRPVILCGPADDLASLAQARALADTGFAARLLGGPLKPRRSTGP